MSNIPYDISSWEAGITIFPEDRRPPMSINETRLKQAIIALTYAEMISFCIRIQDVSEDKINLDDMAATLSAVALSDEDEE